MTVPTKENHITLVDRTLFSNDPDKRTLVASTEDGVSIELPDFDMLFEQIQQISPMARRLMTNKTVEEEEEETDSSKSLNDNTDVLWNIIESMGSDDGTTTGTITSDDSGEQITTVTEEKNNIFEIAKIDNYKNRGCPLIRVQASQVPCDEKQFVNLMMNYDDRRKWDDQVDVVYENYSVADLNDVNKNYINTDKYGRCERLGIGYFASKSTMIASAREQLTLCGIQKFNKNLDGECTEKYSASLIWAVELDEWHNNLLPHDKTRCVRGRTHILSVAMVPNESAVPSPETLKKYTKNDSKKFNIEYCLQLEVGGMIPAFVSTPVLFDSTKKLFKQAASLNHNTGNAIDDSNNLLVEGVRLSQPEQ